MHPSRVYLGVSSLRDRLSIFAASVLLCSFSTAHSASAQSHEEMPEVLEPDQSKLIVGVVREVLDGDSLEVFHDGKVVRYELAGADAPDILNRSDETAVQIAGSVEARSYLFSLLDGEQVGLYVDPKKRTDVRGQPLAYLYRLPDKLFVNLEMVRLGHAKHARDPGGWNNAALLWAQNRAKDAQKGVWDPERIKVARQQAQSAKLDQQNVQAKAKTVKAPALDIQPITQTSVSDTVFVTKSGTKYHTKDCQHVGESAIEMDRSSVTDSHKPCKVCKPDETDSD